MSHPQPYGNDASQTTQRTKAKVCQESWSHRKASLGLPLKPSPLHHGIFPWDEMELFSGVLLAGTFTNVLYLIIKTGIFYSYLRINRPDGCL